MHLSRKQGNIMISLLHLCVFSHGYTGFVFNSERDLKTKCVVEMEGNQTVLLPAGSNLGKGDSR